MDRDWSDVAAALGDAAGARAAPSPEAPVGGGDSHAAWRWRVGSLPIFVKTAPAAQAAMFTAEARGLAELAGADAVRVPAVVGSGTAGDRAWLALEWLDLVPADAAADARLGTALAALHRVQAPQFGFESDNFIGRTPQPNARCADWPAFLRERRLRPQLELAARSGHGGRLLVRGERLLEALGAWFTSYRPVPSLLHGDLWSGNRAALADGTPVIFDPAPYYGDREADVAMTRLFGGFANAFHTAYQSAWPLDAAAGYRRELYNLYHVLNHANLFGGDYAANALAMIDRLLAAVGD